MIYESVIKIMTVIINYTNNLDNKKSDFKFKHMLIHNLDFMTLILLGAKCDSIIIYNK